MTSRPTELFNVQDFRILHILSTLELYVDFNF